MRVSDVCRNSSTLRQGDSRYCRRERNCRSILSISHPLRSSISVSSDAFALFVCMYCRHLNRTKYSLRLYPIMKQMVFCTEPQQKALWILVRCACPLLIVFLGVPAIQDNAVRMPGDFIPAIILAAYHVLSLLTGNHSPAAGSGSTRSLR